METAEHVRARIIHAGLHRVSLNGLVGLSLSDLAGAAGMSKSGVYAHFKSKEALEVALVQAIIDRFRKAVWLPHEDTEPGEPRVRAMVRDWKRWVNGSELEGGCPITPVAAELDDRPGPARDLLAMAQKRWLRHVAREFAAIRNSVRISAVDEQCAFELHSCIVGYGYFTRFLHDPHADARFEESLRQILVRAKGQP